MRAARFLFDVVRKVAEVLGQRAARRIQLDDVIQEIRVALDLNFNSVVDNIHNSWETLWFVNGYISKHRIQRQHLIVNVI
jgi:hypothetical protein